MFIQLLLFFSFDTINAIHASLAEHDLCCVCEDAMMPNHWPPNDLGPLIKTSWSWTESHLFDYSKLLYAETWSHMKSVCVTGGWGADDMCILSHSLQLLVKAFCSNTICMLRDPSGTGMLLVCYILFIQKHLQQLSKTMFSKQLIHPLLIVLHMYPYLVWRWSVDSPTLFTTILYTPLGNLILNPTLGAYDWLTDWLTAFPMPSIPAFLNHLTPKPLT